MGLQELAAIGRLATAGQLAVVLGCPVVASQFLARLDSAPGIEFYAIIGDAYVGVGIAGVIDIAENSATFAAFVDGAFVHFHDSDFLQALDAATSLAQR